MVDERQPGSGAGRNGSRRRHFRNRKRNAPRPPALEAPAQPVERASDRDPERARRERRARRRRRNKGGQPAPSAATPYLPIEDNLEIVSPASVFIYTHVVRPVMRDSYEYRSDHFSKVSRRLEDFQIDLSALDRIEAEGILPPVSVRFADEDEDAEDGADEDVTWEDDEYEEKD